MNWFMLVWNPIDWFVDKFSYMGMIVKLIIWIAVMFLANMAFGDNRTAMIITAILSFLLIFGLLTPIFNMLGA